SWSPMLRAYERRVENPDVRLYDIFLVEQGRVKFQYPPSSLLPFDLLPRSLTRTVNGGLPGPELHLFLTRFSAVTLLLTVLGTAAALVRFGLADHLQYLEVLRTISRSGEAYYPNQSVNGVMNRVLGNGAPAEFSPEFAPYHPVVYFTTLVSSLLILALALRP